MFKNYLKLFIFFASIAIFSFGAGFVKAAPPTITSISPSSITAGYENTIIITGTGYSSATQVKLDGQSYYRTLILPTKMSISFLPAFFTGPGTHTIVVYKPSTSPEENSNTVTLTVTGTTPSIASISPAYKTVGDAGFTLTINGADFTNSAQAKLDGSNRTTTFVNPTKLNMAITTADLSSVGSKNITVKNTTSGEISGALTFTVNNKVPIVTSISLSTKTVYQTPFNLTVTGSNFVPGTSGAKIRINGTNVNTTSATATQLTTDYFMSVANWDSDSAGTYTITVVNPSPPSGGAISTTSATLTVNNPVPTINALTDANPGLFPSSTEVQTPSGPGITLTINGNNFVDGPYKSIARLNGADMATTFSQRIQITTFIPASELLTAGTRNITVFNPGPGGVTSSPARVLTIVAVNPAPTITNLSPFSSMSYGSAPNDLIITGSGFMAKSAGAIVDFTSPPHIPISLDFTHNSSSQLTILASQLNTLPTGNFFVRVTNPAPGGGEATATQRFTVNRGSSTISLSSIPNTSVTGQSVTFTATVSPNTATGTVTFKDGSTTLGTGTLSSGQATLSTSALSVGSHLITASYGGNSNINGITSPVFTQTVNNPPTVDHFRIATISSPKTAGTAFTISITAEDSSNNTVTSFTGTVNLTLNPGNVSLGSTGNFSGGTRTQSVTITQVGTGTITPSLGSINQIPSNSFTINPASASKLVFTTVPSNTVVSLASGIFTVQRQDQFGNPVAVTTNTSVGLFASPSNGTSFRNASNTSNITSVVMSAGSDTVNFKFRSTIAGTFTIFASASPLTQAVASSYIVTAASIPSAPSVLTAAAFSPNQINLYWTDNANNETGFAIERKTGVGGTWGAEASVAADVTSYSSTGLMASTQYFYRVRAFNTSGNSGWSNEADATTFAPEPTTGDLVIKKETIGGNDTFNYFLGSPYSPYSLIPVTTEGNAFSGTGSVLIEDLPPGNQYIIHEIAKIGWKLDSLSCKYGPGNTETGLRAGDSITEVEIVAGQTTTCTFKNSKRNDVALVNVQKQATGGDGTDVFQYKMYTDDSLADQIGQFAIGANQAAGNNQYNGYYQFEAEIGQPWPFISEIIEVDKGWSLTSASCVDQTNQPICTPGVDANRIPNCVNFRTAVAGETVACIFVNVKSSPEPPAQGNLIIKKIAEGSTGNDAFDYYIFPTPLIEDLITDENGLGQSVSPIPLPAGNYSITEVIPYNWKFVSVTCGDKPAVFDENASNQSSILMSTIVVAGQTTTCTFKNLKSTTSDTTDSNTNTSGPLTKLTIVKTAEGEDGAFSYSVTGNKNISMSITTSGGIRSSQAVVDPGTYAISEISPAGWTAISAYCFKENGQLASAAGTNNVNNVILEQGKTTTCYFRNSKNDAPVSGYSRLKIIKTTEGGNGLFTYAISGVSVSHSSSQNVSTIKGAGQNEQNGVTLPPGTYTLTESVPSGWTPVNAYCMKEATSQATGTSSSSGVNGFVVEPGKMTTCYFKNSKDTPDPGKLKIMKETKGGNDTFTYNVSPTPSVLSLTTSGDDTGGSGQSQELELAPGVNTYTVIETLPDEWEFVETVCKLEDGNTTGQPESSGVKDVTIESGKITTCTFKNERRPLETQGIPTGGGGVKVPIDFW